MTNAISVPVQSPLDIVTARQHGRALASMAGFSNTEATIIAAAISEVARNIVEYAISGEVAIGLTDDGARTGVHVVARDERPGRPDLAALTPRLAALTPGLDEFGMGLHGARALMDEFNLHSNPGRGTIVTMTKWLQ